MNISNYLSVDVVNGQGTRATLFVSGCIHKCKGCYNQKTWNKDFGYAFTKEMEDRIIEDLSNTMIKRRGLSLSGGDPLYSGNLETINKLIDRVRLECKGKDIWLWSGYTLDELEDNAKTGNEEDVIRLNIVKKVDVFIDGKFEKDKYDPDLKWKGSANQRVIYLK